MADKLGNVVFELSRFRRQNAEIASERRRHPEIGRERIVRPVFIVGINRSGTTFLHCLLTRDETGVEQLAFMSGVLNGAARFRQTHPELEHHWFDVTYTDLIRDPMAAVRDICGRFDWPLEQTAVDGMSAWLSRQAEQRRREIRHSYRLEDYALTPEAVNRAFQPYLDFAAAEGLLQGKTPALS